MSVYRCDVNVWLALALSEHTHHERARQWLDSVDQPGSVRFCRSTQHALLRLLAKPSVLGAYGNPPLSNDEAWSVYEAFVGDPRIELQTAEPAGLESVWKRLSRRPTASTKLWMDAYLAAFALAGGSRLVTTDAAFGQFDRLDLEIITA